ncbi:MAG: hypothetical protein V4619_06680 [Bacteroidota bacterium]
MKKTALFIATLFAFFATSCKKEVYKTEFEASLQTWQTFKASADNSYVYSTKAPNWIDDSTRITITNGKVTNRDYYKFDYEPSQNGTLRPNKITVLKWKETTANLGSHKEGFDAYTMDQVYDRAKNYWLPVDSKKYNIRFETNNAGIISWVGHELKTIADGFDGIYITSITKL